MPTGILIPLGIPIHRASFRDSYRDSYRNFYGDSYRNPHSYRPLEILHINIYANLQNLVPPSHPLKKPHTASLSPPPSRQRNGAKTTQKLRNLNTEIVSSTLPRPDQAFERPQRLMGSPASPFPARGARGIVRGGGVAGG